MISKFHFDHDVICKSRLLPIQNKLNFIFISFHWKSSIDIFVNLRESLGSNVFQIQFNDYLL